MKVVFIAAYLAGVAWLGGWELAAVITRPAYTISMLTWAAEGTGPTLVRWLIAAFMTGLTLHLAFGWPR